MQQSEFQQIREWYQQFEDAVLFYGRAVCCICSGRNNAASAARR